MSEIFKPISTPSPIVPSIIRLMGDGVVDADDPNWVRKAIPIGTAFYSEEWCRNLVKEKNLIIEKLTAEVDRLQQISSENNFQNFCGCGKHQDDDAEDIENIRSLNTMRGLFGQMLMEMPMSSLLDAMCLSLSYLPIQNINAVFSAVGVDLKANTGSRHDG